MKKHYSCLECSKKLFVGNKIIEKWIGWDDDGGYDYFCSVVCAENYCKDMPKTKNEWIILREIKE